MHHIDRTLQELEFGSGLNGEFENQYETSYEFGSNGEFEQGFGQEFEQGFGQEANFENYAMSSQENQELESAYELLEVSNEAELNQFVGNLMSRAVGAAKTAATNFVASPAGKTVGQYLVNFGKNTLPQLAGQYGAQAGGALGERLGSYGEKAGQWAGNKAGNWAGGKAGNWIASNAQRIFNLELESLSPENQELEIARSFVRFANDLTRKASQVVRSNPNISLASLGKQVLTASAQQHAPGLLTTGTNPGTVKRRVGNQGTWVRKGGAIVLYGA